MGECTICHSRSDEISESLGLCAPCILADTPKARQRAAAVHAQSHQRFGLPPAPPRSQTGKRCQRCINACKIDVGDVGYCGVRRNEDGKLTGGDANCAAAQWYDDPLPTNCVADWVCPASGPAGFPSWTDTRRAEHGFVNLAVFYQACSFDCLYCQNWHFRSHSHGPRRRSASDLADAVTPRTRCICFFGGDPTCQVEHALAAARLARQARGDRLLRICWETNGSGARAPVRR
jgi:pyruvate formate lyase activating enzyme